MTTQLRYLGKHRRGRIKIADAPGYDGKPVEIIYDPKQGDTLTMSDSAAKVVMALYPALFENLTYPEVPPEAPVIDSEGVVSGEGFFAPPLPGDDQTDPPPESKKRR